MTQEEVPQAASNEKPRFWTTRRVIVAVVTVAVMVLSVGGCAGFTVWRYLSSESETMATLRVFVDSAYPEYQPVDSTRSGYILQHNEFESLRIDVRFINPGLIGVWAEAPEEELTSEWSTVETFFRHAEGLPVDPRTDMNYDVDGFVEAYSAVRPGPNSVVCAVWLEDTGSTGVETYVVLVARRNRVGRYSENMWPDHRAVFTRDSGSGQWTASTFEPVEIENPNR